MCLCMFDGLMILGLPKVKKKIKKMGWFIKEMRADVS